MSRTEHTVQTHPGIRRGPAGLLIVLLLVSLSVLAVEDVAETPSPLAGRFETAKTQLNNGNFQAAHRILLPLARAGYAEAQDVLAAMYLQGLGVAVNRQRAMQWYCALAHQPQGGRMVSRAVWLLAEYFRTGGGLPSYRYKGKRRENEDPYRAYFWFEILARQKNYYQQVYQDGEKLGNIGRYIMARQLTEAEIDQIKSFLERWEPQEPVVSLENCLALPRG